MSKLKKLVLIGAIVIVVLGVGAVLIVFSHLNEIVKASIADVGPRLTGTSVVVDDVNISIFSGKLKVQGLNVGNPDGFNTDSAFAFDSLDVHMNLRSLTSDTIIIHKVVVHAPQVTYEMSARGSNLKQIQTHIEQFQPQPTGEEDPAAGKRVIIEHFEVTDGKVRVSASMLNGRSATLPLPAVQLTDIGKDGDASGATWQEAIEQMYGVLFGVIRGVVAGGTDVIGDAAGRLGEVTIEGAVQDVRDTARKSLGGIRNMFGGGKDEK